MVTKNDNGIHYVMLNLRVQLGKLPDITEQEAQLYRRTTVYSALCQ